MIIKINFQAGTNFVNNLRWRPALKMTDFFIIIIYYYYYYLLLLLLFIIIIITSDNLLSAVNGKPYQGSCTDN